MQQIMQQISAILNINIKSMRERLLLTLSTIIAVALVIGVLLCFLAMAYGFKITMQGTGRADVAIILRSGATAEINSSISLEQANIIAARYPHISKELYVIVDAIKKATGTETNIPLRGLSQTGINMRLNITMLAGRMFTPGTNELIVGSNLLKTFSGFELGKQIKLGNTYWQVVGVFDAGGSVFGSELLTDVNVLQAAFNRLESYQTVRVKLDHPNEINNLINFINNDPRLKLDVMSEQEFYAKQAGVTSDLIFYLGWPLAITMALGALAGAINTMYNNVMSRTNDIITLRILGFRSYATFIATLLESIIIALIGGLLGSIIAYLAFDGLTTSTLSGNFTQVVFQFTLSKKLIFESQLLAFIIGLLGGIAPARYAARLKLTNIGHVI